MKKLIVLVITFLSISASAQWIQMSEGIGGGKNILSFATIGADVFAGVYSFPTGPSGVYRSTNNGANWTQTSLTGIYIGSLEAIGNNLFAGIYYPSSSGGGLYVSSDRGASWLLTAMNIGVVSLAVSGGNIYAGSINNGVFISHDTGRTWPQINLINQNVLSLATSGNTVYASTADSGIYVSTNKGTDWFHTPVNNQAVYSLATLGSRVFAGTQNVGIVSSTNNGGYWSQAGLSGQWVYQLEALGNNVVAATHSNGIYLSTNYGTNWSTINDGFSSVPSVNTFLIANNFVYAGTKNNSVWRRPLSELVVVQNSGTGIPSSYSLSQNYPNPFNPSTVIRFGIPSLSKIRRGGEGFSQLGVGIVTLKIFDITGREVRTLVNESLAPGTYEVKFDGSMLNSGVYFYKLVTNGFTDSKRMLLIK
jgi:Secretion system C-terminal sorting domain